MAETGRLVTSERDEFLNESMKVKGKLNTTINECGHIRDPQWFLMCLGASVFKAVHVGTDPVPRRCRL